MSRINHAVYKLTSYVVRHKTKSYAGCCCCNCFFALITIVSGLMMLTPPGSYDWLVSGADLVTSWDCISNAQSRADPLASAANESTYRR